MAVGSLLKGSSLTMSYWTTVQWAGVIARNARAL
jgi:hypothetical protein